MKAYGWPPSLIDEQEIDILFASLNYNEESETQDGYNWNIVEPWDEDE